MIIAVVALNDEVPDAVIVPPASMVSDAHEAFALTVTE